MKASERDWVVLFGGADRERSVLVLHERGVRIVAVIAPETRHPRLQMSIDRLRQHGLPLVTVTRSQLDQALLEWSGCAMLSVGFPFLIPSSVLMRHDLRLNVHPTLLPRYRGPTTGAYILMNGDTESGSTVHVLDEEMDKGAIVAQSHVPISKFDTVRSLQRKVYASEPQLVMDALRHLDGGRPQVPQNEAAASTFPAKRTPADSEIDPTKPLVELFDAIRACDAGSYPAFFYVDGQKVCVKLWRPDRLGDESDTL